MTLTAPTYALSGSGIPKPRFGRPGHLTPFRGKQRGTPNGGLRITRRTASSTSATCGSSLAATHKVCPYSNATPGNVDVKLRANGRELEAPLRRRWMTRRVARLHRHEAVGLGDAVRVV